MKLIIFLVAVPSLIFGMDLNNNNNNNNLFADWPIALPKSTSPQEFLAHLTIEQKIAQLFMPGMQLNDESDFGNITELIKKYPIGGVLLTHPNSSDIAVTYIQCLHDSNKVADHPLPLWIAMDAEWGPSQRLPDMLVFPKAMTLAATNNQDLMYEYGAEIGNQLEKLGIHINFAPVLDVNNNAANPVIGIRSFGEDPTKVTLAALLYWTGGMDKVLFCAKHFPGHGDTDVDSHEALPIINHSFKRLQEVELKPFERFIKMGIPMIMVAHLLIPVLDDTVPASLSPKIITDLLRKEMKFGGLIITDGLKMKAVADTYNSADLALLAFKAGNDIILQLEDTAAGIEALKAAYNRNEITKEQIDERVARILQAKYRQGLLQKDPYPEMYAKENLYTPYAYDLQRRLYEAAMTLVNNDNHILPISTAMLEETLLIAVNSAECFAQELEKKDMTVKRLSRVFDRAQVVSQLSNFKNIIISIAGMNNLAKESYGISEDAKFLCNYIQELKDGSQKRTMLVLFGMPYAASLLKHQGLLVAYEDNQAAQQAAAKIVLGECKLTGKLPVSIGTLYPIGTGVSF